MIELFYSPTPNGKKVSIMLEETKINYKITHIDLSKDEQFKPEFLKLNPYGKIPAIIDHEKNLTLIESGAILIYLAKKSNKFLPKENDVRWCCDFKVVTRRLTRHRNRQVFLNNAFSKIKICNYD